MTQKATLAWRLWIVFAQAVAVAAGALIAWRTFSPADVAVCHFQKAIARIIKSRPHGFF